MALVSLIGRITKLALISVAALSGLLVLAIWFVATMPTPAGYQLTAGPTPSPAAPAWAVFDGETGDLIVSRHADEQRPIASITKLFAASHFFTTARLSATTTITTADLAPDGSAGRLQAGQVYTQHELLFALLLESSNDAAAAIERIDPDIVTRMNHTAAALDLTATQFIDASGLSSANHSTPRELARLAGEVYATQPHTLAMSRLSRYLAAQNAWQNNSPTITTDAYRGGKHGYLPEAGYTYLGFFTETLADEQERVIGYILLGSDNLASDVAALRTFANTRLVYQ